MERLLATLSLAVQLVFICKAQSVSAFERSDFTSQRTIAGEVSDNSCLDLLKTLSGPSRFLRNADAHLHLSRNVVGASQGVSELRTPEDKIAYWITRLESRLTAPDEAARNRDIATLRRFYRLHHIIRRENVPESYFDAQRRIMREQGHGDVTITDTMRSEAIDTIRADQRQSLNIWMDYLLSSDADQYPVWVRYWSFEGMLKLGVFNEETGKFSTRTASTVAPFPELNREAFAEVVDVLVRRVSGDSLDDLTDETFRNLVESGASFGKLYGRRLAILRATRSNSLSETEGQWIKYNQRSSADDLVESLKGKNTGWCTAGHSTATTQLRGGDFYVYYSKDETGRMTNPRLAIRMEGNRIAEVRGVAADQNVDEYMAGTKILEDKLKEFGTEGDRYVRRSADMRRLTEIERRHRNGNDLTEEDLRFLYEVDEKIEGFGYQRDPRIEEIIATRNIKEDLVFVSGYREDEISTTKQEALSGGIKFHVGDLDLTKLESFEGVSLPERITGNLHLSQSYFELRALAVSLIAQDDLSVLQIIIDNIFESDFDLILTRELTRVNVRTKYKFAHFLIDQRKYSILRELIEHILPHVHSGDNSIEGIKLVSKTIDTLISLESVDLLYWLNQQRGFSFMTTQGHKDEGIFEKVLNAAILFEEEGLLSTITSHPSDESDMVEKERMIIQLIEAAVQLESESIMRNLGERYNDPTHRNKELGRVHKVLASFGDYPGNWKKLKDELDRYHSQEGQSGLRNWGTNLLRSIFSNQ